MSKNYIASAIRTENRDFEGIGARLSNPSNIRISHAAIGMVTEAAEFLDAYKKHGFYGKALDNVNLKEEIGDMLYYIAIACDELGITFEEAMATNIAKLQARYPQKFTLDNAVNRDLEKERVILSK